MSRQLLIAGGGMGGLATAIAAARAGWQPHIFEQAKSFSEAGAGIQLAANATRLLGAWELGPALAQVAALPQELNVRSASSGMQLASMRLGPKFAARYGAPYACVHRADLHAMLLERALELGCRVHLASRVVSVQESANAVLLRVEHGAEVQGDALAGADGLWSSVRAAAWADGPPAPTGHLAFRALLRQTDLPAGLRSTGVTVWLGARLHVVAYPVRGGESLNVVAIVQGARGGDAQDWDQAGVNADLHQATGATCSALRNLLGAPPAWRMWVLHARPAVEGPQALVRGRVALIGDAGHPMRPYLAQGACMAIEDADELGRCLAIAGEQPGGVPAALRHYALNRWERAARVQRRSARNGRIFHATGPLRWGRDLALKVLGERLLDVPWLYGRLGSDSARS